MKLLLARIVRFGDSLFLIGGSLLFFWSIAGGDASLQAAFGWSNQNTSLFIKILQVIDHFAVLCIGVRSLLPLRTCASYSWLLIAIAIETVLSLANVILANALTSTFGGQAVHSILAIRGGLFAGLWLERSVKREKRLFQ